ncbi:MAG TPA: NAD(P)-binding protein [Gammaproteobacteria bacterium]|nr:NAD(P)-binding protein [Gammaproteobacteria bacterium]
MSDIEELDAVVIGASTRGLIATYLLSVLGYRAVLLEKAPFVGSGDGSFQLSDGTWFDLGMHVLDEMRSPIATRLFRHVVGQNVNRLKLKRAIVLRNHIMPYAPEPGAMPNEIRRLLHPGELVDDIGDELPTRARLAQHYGPGFADLIYDEVLPSYPTEHRHLTFGVDEAELLVNIYPWFFPRARRTPKHGDISRAFHDRLRSGIDQYILYPLDGGFGGFARGFVKNFDRSRIEVLTGASDVEILPATSRHRIDHVKALGRAFRARHYFWASGWPDLCRLLGVPCQNPATDRIVLGSFKLNEPVVTQYHEILVGDPRHEINRVSLPGAFRGSSHALVQVEFAFPSADSRPLDGDSWQSKWVQSLRELGVLKASHRVEIFDFKSRPLHFNGYGMEGVRLIDADPHLIDAESNVRPIVPSMSNLNLNAHVPLDVAYVTNVLATDSQ